MGWCFVVVFRLFLCGRAFLTGAALVEACGCVSVACYPFGPSSTVDGVAEEGGGGISDE